MSQLPPPDWNPFGTSSRPHGAPWFRQFAWTAAVVIGVLVLAYLGACVASGESRSAILLSGLDVPYQVTVNGTSYALPPKAFREISVAEGDLDIVLQLVDGRSYTETVHLASPLLTRPFRDELVVLNPDRCAILAHDQGGYDVRPRLVDPDAFHRIHIGEVLYTFDHIEHVFEALPYDIRVSGPETRRSVRAVTTGMTAEQHQIIVDAVGATEAQRIVRRVLDLDPRNGEFLRIAAEFLDANEMAAHCRPSLDQRPLDIDWHIAYQDAMWFGRPGADIESEYRAIAASLPDDPGAQYLHARSRPWDADTESMFVALSANPRYATRALAARHLAYLSSGRFEEALTAARSMRRLDPSDDALIGPEIDALHALGRLDEAIGLALQWWQLESTNGGRAIVLMSLRHEAGRAAEAADVVREFTWAESARVDVVVRRWEPRLRSALAYLTADVEGYEFALARREDASGRLEAALSRGDDDDALAQLLMAPAGLRSLEDCLSVAVGAAHRGHHATHAAFDAAMDVLARTRQSGHALVERLRAGERLRIDDVLAASLNPRETALLLLALAQRERIDRAAAHDLARRIMFDRTPPYRIVRMVLTRT